MEFSKIRAGKGDYYWTWRDYPFLPYSCLEKVALKELPTPFLLEDLHPNCPIGFESKDKEKVTNVVDLANVKLDNDFRKDLKRVEKKNEDVKLIFNEKDALGKSKQWFLELWKENKKDFSRRLKIWKEKCYTISAYVGDELIAVHIAMEEGDTVYYFGCWWNREYKNRSIPTFLLKKDIDRAIERKNRFYDLGIGDEPYKKKWGVAERPTKYFAVMSKKLAEELKVEEFIEG